MKLIQIYTLNWRLDRRQLGRGDGLGRQLVPLLYILSEPGALDDPAVL